MQPGSSVVLDPRTERRGASRTRSIQQPNYLARGSRIWTTCDTGFPYLAARCETEPGFHRGRRLHREGLAETPAGPHPLGRRSDSALLLLRFAGTLEGSPDTIQFLLRLWAFKYSFQ